jgi:hypothetical protein
MKRQERAAKAVALFQLKALSNPSAMNYAGRKDDFRLQM